MEAICKELDETKAAMTKLMEEYKAKSSLAESLRIAHDGQLAKICEMKQQVENQAEELKAKAVEIDGARKLYEELSSSFHEKEVALRQLNSANEHLRASYSQKLQKYDEEKKELIAALDGATTKSEDQEQNILAFEKEIEDLKGALLVSQKKCADANDKIQTMLTAMKQMEVDIESKNANLLELSENKVHCDLLKIKLVEMERNLANESTQRIAAQNMLEELKQRDGVLHKYEEENNNMKEQLKWKKEQFLHLEEAHKKLQNEFQAQTHEWKTEKNAFLDEIGRLQNDMESQSRMLDDLKSRLQMCHQALAHEESRRKLLEIQFNKSQVGYENIAAEFQEAQSMIVSLTLNRDEQIAGLRGSLTAKEALLKEMEHKLVHLEHEKQELQDMVNELQKSQITEARMSSSVSKLQHKFKVLEQTHRECSNILKEKEAEWSSKVGELVRDLDECQADLNSRDNQVHDLQLELENCHSLLSGLVSQNEEISVILLVVRSGILQTQSELDVSRVQVVCYIRKKEQEIHNLKQQVEEKERELDNVLSELENTRANADTLLMRVESLDALEQQSSLLGKELQQHKEMLDESLKQQNYLKEQALKMEISLKHDLNKAADELEKKHIQLAEKTRREMELDFELQRWKSVAERLKVAQTESEAQERSYQELIEEQQIETEVLVHSAEERFKQQREKYLQIIDSKSLELQQFKEKVLFLEQSLEHDVNVSFRDQQFEIEKLANELLNNQVIIDKMSATHILDKLDVDMKNSWVVELEEETGKLKQDLESQRRMHAVQHKQTELLKEKLESVGSCEYKWKRTIAQMEERSKCLEEKLKSEERNLFELKEQLRLLELEKLHAEEMLALQNEQVVQLNSKLRSVEFAMSENSNIISKQREEIEALVVKLQSEGNSSSELKQRIHLLEDELNQKKHAEEVVSALHQEQLLQYEAKLGSVESIKRMDKDLISMLEQQAKNLQQKLALEEKISVELRERIQLLEDELERISHAEQELLNLQQKQTEQVHAKLRSVEASKSELSSIVINLEEEIKGLKDKLTSKERLSSELKEKIELLERELNIKLHTEEEQRAFLQEEIRRLNAKVRSMETANNELNIVILKLEADLRLAKETSEMQAVQIRNFQEELANSNDTIRQLSDERDEMRKRAEFFTKLPIQIDNILCQDLDLLNSFQVIKEDIASYEDEKDDTEPLRGDCGLFTNDFHEQSVVDLIRQNQKLLEDLDEFSIPRKEAFRTMGEECQKQSAASGKYRTDRSLERLPLKELNG